MENFTLSTDTKRRQVVFRPEKTAGVRLVSGNDNHVFADCSGPHQVVRVGSWLAELCRGAIGLRYLPGNPAQSRMEITFDGVNGTQTADMRIIFAEGGSADKDLTREGVEKIILTADSLILHTHGQTGRQNGGSREVSSAEAREGVVYPQDSQVEVVYPRGGRTGVVNPRTDPAGTESPAGDLHGSAERTTEVTDEELRDRIREFLQEEDTAQKNRNALTDQINAEQRDMESATDQLDDLNGRLKKVREEAAQKKKELADAEEELEKARKELDQFRKEKADAEAELQRLREEKKKLEEEREQLRGESEITELDLETAREEIRGLRQRLADDTLTVGAMSEDALIGTGAVKDNLEKAAAYLEKAEKKIEIIVKLREAINSGVQDAVVRRGTEFMTSAQEAGSL